MTDGGPRDEMALRLLCAFTGVPIAAAPADWGEHFNRSTRAAWARVAEVIDQEVARKMTERSHSDQALDLAVRALDQGQALIDAMLKQLQHPGPLKLCRDCKWCRYMDVAHSPCMHERASLPAINLVTGREADPPLYCINMRVAVGAPCGVDARLFEAREP